MVSKEKKRMIQSCTCVITQLLRRTVLDKRIVMSALKSMTLATSGINPLVLFLTVVFTPPELCLGSEERTSGNWILFLMGSLNGQKKGNQV